MKYAVLVSLVIALGFVPRSFAAADPWAALHFLEGTWEASTHGGNGAQASGSYTFQRELKNHILARISSAGTTCKGPADFDCNHRDLLYVFQEAEGLPLEGIYFDNEGHVIHYQVTTPNDHTAIFLSPETGGPQFQLVYELNGGVMSGKFQMRMPGQADWKSYLEWAGARQK